MAAVVGAEPQLSLWRSCSRSGTGGYQLRGAVARVTSQSRRWSTGPGGQREIRGSSVRESRLATDCGHINRVNLHQNYDYPNLRMPAEYVCHKAAGQVVWRGPRISYSRACTVARIEN